MDQKKKKPNLSIRKEVSFSGPLPPPQALAQYERIAAGTADRIIKMAQEQARHRQHLEQEVVASNIRNERLGMHYALILSIVAIVGGIVLLIENKSIAGFITLIGTLGFHGYNFLSTQKQESDDKKERELEDEKL